MLSKRLLYKFLDGRPITETMGIILVCFDSKYTWAYKKTLKIKSLFTNLLHRGPRVGQPCSTRTTLILCVSSLNINYQRSKLGYRRKINSTLRHSSS